MEIRNECLQFFKRVMEDLGHLDWKLRWYEDGHEGFCWLADARIMIGPEQTVEKAKRLILHEVAHIDTCLHLNDKHAEEWQERFKLLCHCYGFDPFGDFRFTANGAT